MSASKSQATQERKSQTYNWYNEISPDVRSFSAAMLKDKKRGAVLDIGESEGKHAIYFARIGFEGHGIHRSSEAIKRARAFASKTGVNESTHFRVGDVFALPYPERFFDVVIDSGCLHHIRKSDWEQYFESVLRVMKDDAYFYLMAYGLKDKQAKGIRRNYVVHQGQYDYFFGKKELKDLVSPFFDIVEMKEEMAMGPDGDHHFYFHLHMKRIAPSEE